MLNLGGAFIAARLNDSYRDMQQVIPFLFRLLQFVSGVMYPIERYADSGHIWLHRLIVWNPIVRILEMYRWVFLGTPMDLAAAAKSAVTCAVILVLGFRYFIAAEHRYGRA
jgi:teichoic acid transport system permease protein